MSERLSALRLGGGVLSLLTVCLLVGWQRVTSQSRTPTVPAITRMWFTPVVVPEGYSQPVRFEADVTDAPSSVVFEYNGLDRAMFDDGTHGDIVAGDGVWTRLFQPSEILNKLTAAWVFRPFIGYCKPFGGRKIDAFAYVWTSAIGLADARQLNATAQRTDYVVNFTTSYMSYLIWTKRFYSFFADSFDFLTIVRIGSVDFLPTALHDVVKNDVLGIGLLPRDNTVFYGSRGRLKGVNVFSNVLDGAGRVFNHEIGHQWVNYVNGANIGSGIPHWPKGDLATNVMGYAIPGTTQGGDMYAYTFTPNGQGGYVVAFNQAPNANTNTFNNMELYLMGLVPPNEVGTFFVLNNQNQDVTNGQVLQPSEVTLVTLNDVVSAAGVRVPDSSASQKAFRVATILLSDAPLEGYALSLYDWFARRVEQTQSLPCSEGIGLTPCKPFYVATGGRGTMTANIADALLTFSDDPLGPGVTMIRAAHIIELRSRIDAVRDRLGLPPFAWTDPSVTVGTTTVRVQHLVDLRTALSQAYVAAGQTPPTFGDPTLAPGMNVKAAHIMELRTAVIAIQ